MKTISEIDKAYLAGFFDGEGSVGIYMNSPGGSNKKYHFLKVVIVNTDIELMEKLYNKFGQLGSLQYIERPKKNWKNRADWVMSHRNAEEFLNIVQPFVYSKKKQVELAFEFIESQSGNDFGKSGMDETCIANRERIRKELMELK